MKTWKEIEAASDAHVLQWAAAQAWAEAMSDCAQDTLWHAEGDVWTHTHMVCRELAALDVWESLDRKQQLILLFTGLFHDAGKPATTRVDESEGRIRSPKHAQVGSALARDVLRGLGCDLETRERICRLVLFHGRPPYLIDKEDPDREVIYHSWLVENRLLHAFALADTRGRKTSDTRIAEEKVNLWKWVAEDRGCFETPYVFANEQARFLFYRDALSSLHYAPRLDYRCEVTLMCGLPGAGKDTWLANRAPELPVVSLDMIRQELGVSPEANQGVVIQTARERVRQNLRAGKDFAFNATNTTRLIRKRWLDLFADYGARISIVYLEPPIVEWHRQNRSRPQPVPGSVMDQLMERLEPPSIAEAHHVSYWPSARSVEIS